MWRDILELAFLQPLLDEPWYKPVRDLVIVTVGSLLGLLSLISLALPFDLLDPLWFRAHAPALALACLALGLTVSLVNTYRRLSRELSVSDADDSARRLSGALVEEVEELARQARWREVVRVGSVLSRPLWLSGRFRERIKVGELVEHAAPFVEEWMAQVEALIDMTGWTNALLGELDAAQRNIERGIEVAREKALPYLLAKGYRHLGGLHYLKPDLDRALHFLQQAEQAAEEIPNPAKREEMLGGIQYGRAEVHRRRHDFGTAEECNRAAGQLYKEAGQQDERMIKIEVQRGEIFLGQRKPMKAKESFARALKVARDYERPEPQCNALTGLARIHLDEDRPDRALPFLEQAAEICAELHLPSGEVDQLLRQARERTSVTVSEQTP